jgi:sugar fermentation stimulation protein A
LRFFGNTEKALFLSRPNRFTILCELNGKITKAFLPNPGRLWELLLPGAPVYLEDASHCERMLPYTAVAVERENHPVVLDTHRANSVVRFLIERGRVPGLEGTKVLRGEVTRGQSRFDFLLLKGTREIILEVKSCTLFSRRVAMFPDAVTSRGKRHVEELASLSNRRTSGAVVFLIQWPRAEVFMPEYHTDLDFAEALLSARRKIKVIPLSLKWRKDLSLRASDVRVLGVPWGTVEREAKDRGSYLLLLKLPRETAVEVGSLGKVRLRGGHYIYVGSAKKSLSKRIERHRRLRKALFWHIDYLRAVADFHAALPIRTEDDLECEISEALSGVSEWHVPGFGSSDCSCPSHLFGMEGNPLASPRFHTLLQFYRMERLLKNVPIGAW